MSKSLFSADYGEHPKTSPKKTIHPHIIALSLQLIDVYKAQLITAYRFLDNADNFHDTHNSNQC